jgi:glyoxylase-like metal-dependent hydrolase (beta-lactamase superfamily II)
MGAVHESGFAEVADGCYIARYLAWDTTIGAIVGSDGVLVVDTRASLTHGEEIREHVRRLAPGRPVRWVVDTHEHFDHVLGNAAFPDAAVHAHETAAANMVESVAASRADISAAPEGFFDDPAFTPEVLEGVVDSPLRVPDVTFASVATIDLGDRYVELVHPGRGHTGGDLLLRAPDADVVFAGDLIEESGPPAYGSDCFPLDWPSTLDFTIGVLTANTVVVPGHGAAVDRAFVADQREDVARVADVIRGLYEQGVRAEDAVAAGGAEWPFGDHPMDSAVRCGYAQLSEFGAPAGLLSPRSLPLA